MTSSLNELRQQRARDNNDNKVFSFIARDNDSKVFFSVGAQNISTGVITPGQWRD
jgi:hypothetical protein